MKKLLLSAGLVASLFAANQYEIGIGAGKHNVTNSPIDNYNFLNVRVGKYLPKNHILRLEFEKSEKILKNTESLTRVLLNVEHYFTLKDSKLSPYAFVGAGYQWVSGAYRNDAVADLGLGTKYSFKSNLNAFVELRGLRDFDNNDNHFGAIIGVNYLFGDSDVKEAVKQVLDNDQDGVSNDMDKCPNTPAGVKVDSNGCALDTDKDGVADYKDKCANTPAGAKVDSNGCALDTDKDGVADYKDKCANTPAGAAVDANGCTLTYNFHITFDNNSAKIKPEFVDTIKKFAKFLKDNPQYKASIEGYTDNRGSVTYNKKLSEKRAKAVYEELIKLGISKDRLSYKGFGPENPIASNDTAQGRAENRRVVAKLYY